MSLIESYLNINNDYSDLNIFGIGSGLIESIISYQRYYVEYYKNPDNVNDYIINKIHNFIDEKYNKINIDNADINYYIQHINIESKIKFKDVIKQIDIDHLISMMDYKQNSSNNYKKFHSEYFKYFNNKITNGKYNMKNSDKNLHLHEQIDENWTNITFNNVIEFTQTLNRMKYFGQNVENFQFIIENKFDNKDNIKKLIEYLTENFVEENELAVDEFSIDDNTETKRFNFRFVIDNLKSNGFSLFEDYFVQLKNRYKQNINIEHIKRDKRLVNYFMQIVSAKDSNSVNRFVNDMLIRIRDYLFDLEDSYNNNQAYQKIRVEKTSEKYAELDLSNLKRDNHNFIVMKYNFGPDDLVNKIKLNEKIEPYFDIFKAYYKSRYPDREIDFDIINSTLIVKMKYESKVYYIHMALIQYIVLDTIMKSESGCNILELVSKTDIPILNIQDAINSMLKIKLIARTTSDSIENIKFVHNKNFSYEKNKISIASMVLKDKVLEKDEKPKEFLHDRSMIVLCNIVDYVKKNKFFCEDTIMESIKYKIPFTVGDELLKKVIEEAISKDLIKKVVVPNNSNNSNNNGDIKGIEISEQVMYQYNE